MIFEVVMHMQRNHHYFSWLLKNSTLGLTDFFLIRILLWLLVLPWLTIYYIRLGELTSHIGLLPITKLGPYYIGIFFI
jgi:hypothetical protein